MQIRLDEKTGQLKAARRLKDHYKKETIKVRREKSELVSQQQITSVCFRKPSICSLQSTYCPCQNFASSCNSPIFLENKSEDTLDFPTPLYPRQ
jgi:uncharacterized membrane protein YgaE (UPF0421/DUF939 family)